LKAAKRVFNFLLGIADGVFAGRSVFETSAVESPSRCDMKIA
jgi:hypothetical protein